MIDLEEPPALERGAGLRGAAVSDGACLRESARPGQWTPGDGRDVNMAMWVQGGRRPANQSARRRWSVGLAVGLLFHRRRLVNRQREGRPVTGRHQPTRTSDPLRASRNASAGHCRIKSSCQGLGRSAAWALATCSGVSARTGSSRMFWFRRSSSSAHLRASSRSPVWRASSKSCRG